MTIDNSQVSQIERQLSKLESTATNLETLAALAARANKTQESKSLSDQAVDLRVRQFALYRNKDRLQTDSKEWKAFIAAIELVNHFIEESTIDLKAIRDVQDSAARLISVVSKLVAGTTRTG